MNLRYILKEHIETAARELVRVDDPEVFPRTDYWIEVNGMKFPFKQLIRTAHELTPGNAGKRLEFVSSTSSRGYIESLGFPITKQMKTKYFFKKTDLDELARYGKLTYDPENIEHARAGELLKEHAWEKTRFWTDKVLSELSGYDFTFKKLWLQRDWSDGRRVASFKGYTWSRIYKKGDDGKDIYFTVGADGDLRALVIKLDYQFLGESEMSKKQQALCKLFFDAHPELRIQIPEDQLNEYNWDRLAKETVEFIHKNQDLYNEIISEIWGSTQKRIARIAYNTNGWTMPSGVYGKSDYPGSHEAMYGYGHEEWLMDIDKLIDGYHYGFLEPVRKHQSAFEGKQFDIWLYTINSKSKKRYWVGEIKNVEVLNTEQIKSAIKYYTEMGWLEQMNGQILECKANSTGFSEWKDVDLFNIRYDPELLLVNEPVEIPEDNPITDLPRYIFAHFKDEFTLSSPETEDYFSFGSSVTDEDVDNDSVHVSRYETEPKVVELRQLHRRMSKALGSYLKTIYGELNVSLENLSGYGANKIDIVVREGKDLVFYEIKTYTSLRVCIREALGQVMEYCLWTNKKRAKKMIVITPPLDGTNDAFKYFEHLRNEFDLPVYYQSFDIEKNILSEL